MTVRATGEAERQTTVSKAKVERQTTVHAKGKVERIYVHRNGLYIRLAGIKVKPKDEYFYLLLTHPNYNALFSLASMAAMGGRVLWVRTVKDITPTEYGEVEYMVLDF